MDAYFHDLWHPLHRKAQDRLEKQASNNLKRYQYEAKEVLARGPQYAAPAAKRPRPGGFFQAPRPGQLMENGGQRPIQVCEHWQRGTCNRGDRCRFAHATQERGPAAHPPLLGAP